VIDVSLFLVIPRYHNIHLVCSDSLSYWAVKVLSTADPDEKVSLPEVKKGIEHEK
jgi:hypothetical protein